MIDRIERASDWHVYFDDLVFATIHKRPASLRLFQLSQIPVR